SLGLDPRGILTTFRAPLYPAFLAVIYMAFGAGEDRFLAARFVQAGLGAILSLLTYAAALRLLEGQFRSNDAVQKAARSAGVMVAAYPMLVLFPLGLATENLFFPLVLASVLTLLALARRHSLPTGAGRPPAPQIAVTVVAGVLLGLSALTRSVIVPFALAAFLWIWLDLRRPRTAVLAALAFGCTIAPWVARNSVLSGRPTGIETSMGYNLYLGYHPDSTGTFTFGPSLDLLPILDDGVRDQVGIQAALKFMRDDPARFPYLALRRLGHFFDLEWRAFAYFYSNGLLGPLATPVLFLVLGALGVPFAFLAASALFGATTLGRSSQTTLLVLLFAAYLAPHILILSEERFHVALVPFLAVLAAAAWVKRGAAPRAQPLSLWLAAAGVALLVLNWCSQLVRNWPTLVRLMGASGYRLYLPY
ncbi:MAG: hypothetical protein V1755_04170, partial [Chloroflexota bacterium]